ncbi:MAG: hypothetical protein IPG81_15675 [Sandaracinaceae bacterium]|nr:hypothetical protein [Sandaracinaceae bacterium]
MNARETTNQRTRRRLVEAGLGLGVLRFGGPLVVGMVLHTLFNLVDMFMISRLPNSGAALAALGLCDMVAAVATILSNGIATAAVALITRHVGAGYLTGVRRATYQSLWLVGALSVAFGLLGIFGSDFIVRRIMFAKGDTADVAVVYLEVMLGGSFSIFLLLHLTAVLRALGHAKTATMLLVGGNALNILLNVFLIYGDGPAPDMFAWGLPSRAPSASRGSRCWAPPTPPSSRGPSRSSSGSCCWFGAAEARASTRSTSAPTRRCCAPSCASAGPRAHSWCCGWRPSWWSSP